MLPDSSAGVKQLTGEMMCTGKLRVHRADQWCREENVGLLFMLQKQRDTRPGRIFK